MSPELWNTLVLIVTRIALPLVLLFAVGSAVSGWVFLARKYPDQPAPVDQSFSSTSGYFGGLIGGYRMSITVGVGPRGVRLSMIALFRLFHPPIFVPWSAITGCSIAQFLGFRRSVRIDIAGSRRSVYLYGFLWKYGDAVAHIVECWEKARQTGLTTECIEHREKAEL